MIRGLDRFREHFIPFSTSYALIGGTACTLAMEEAGLDFRATRDLDIVLYIEALDKKFVTAFREFIKMGKYLNQQRSTGERQFYRFKTPRDETFPDIIELFSRRPDGIELFQNSHLTPIPIEDEIVSLSAMLLDEDCYQFIHAGKRNIHGLSIVGSEHLIPIKARAWADLSAKHKAGLPIKKEDIRKHPNDIVRLSQLLRKNMRIALPASIKDGLKQLFFEWKKQPIDPKVLGLKQTPLGEVVALLSLVYEID